MVSRGTNKESEKPIISFLQQSCSMDKCGRNGDRKKVVKFWINIFKVKDLESYKVMIVSMKKK